jgi:hypothetical protein
MIRTSWLLLSYHQQQQRTRFHRCHSDRPLSLRHHHRTWSSTSTSLSIIGNGGTKVLYRPNNSTNRSVSRHCLPSSVCVVVPGGGGTGHAIRATVAQQQHYLTTTATAAIPS